LLISVSELSRESLKGDHMNFKSLPGSTNRQPGSRLLTKVCVVAIMVVALVVLVVAPAAVAIPSFPDVTASHPYYAAITHLASENIINGKADGKFYPNDAVMRQQFAKMIVKTMGHDVPADIVCPFADVSSTPNPVDPLYPAKYVAVCALHGITVGKTPTTFDPFGNITRFQVLTMVVRAVDEVKPGLLVAPPGNFVPSWAPGLSPQHGANAARAEYNGLTLKLSLSTLDPFGNMTRGEVAQVLHNVLLKIASTTPSTTTTTTAPPTTTTTTAPPTTTTTTAPPATTTTTAPLTAHWQKIDGYSGSKGIVASGYNLYQIHKNGSVWKYTGTPFKWQKIDGDPTTVEIVADGNNLYQRCTSGSIWKYNGTPFSWQRLDNNAATKKIAASGGRLYQMHKDGKIWKYTGTPMTGWQKIDQDPDTRDIVAGGSNLYQRCTNGSIWKYNGTPFKWQKIDGDPTTVDIVADGSNLYQRCTNGSIWKYNGTPFKWQRLDNNAATKKIAASGGNLYQIHKDGKIWKYVGPPITGWKKIDDYSGSKDIVADGINLYQIHTDGSIWKYLP
jgi:hypothetical protein